MSFVVGTKIQGLLFLAPETVFPIFNSEFKKALTEATLLTQHETVKRTPVNTGALRQSIGSEVRGAGLNLEGVVGTPLKYALPVEEGAAPHFPPSGPIELWVKQKNLSYIMFSYEITVPQLAHLIARKINITGLKARNMFSDAYEASKDRIEIMLYAAQNAVISKVGF